jgi:hypothetical protein
MDAEYSTQHLLNTIVYGRKTGCEYSEGRLFADRQSTPSLHNENALTICQSVFPTPDFHTPVKPNN